MTRNRDGGAYYNEIDPFCAAWLRNLITAGHLPAGDVDERDIREVPADDVRGYTQAHFFAGIGGWPYALRLAGWPDDRAVWTGSCPCQPLSSAGQRRGHADERHLWPAFHRLIAECRPAVVFGEQVAGKLGNEWIAAVRADLEGDRYAVGAADLPAACVRAPNIRQRIFWMADAAEPGRREGPRRTAGTDRRAASEPGRLCDLGALADPNVPERPGCGRDARKAGIGQPANGGGLGYAAGAGPQASSDAETPGSRRDDPRGAVRPSGCLSGWVVDADSAGSQPGGSASATDRHGASADPTGWDDLVWLRCRDGKARPTQPGLFPLAHGVPGRVGRLRAYGNAINPWVGRVFIRACMECRP